MPQVCLKNLGILWILMRSLKNMDFNWKTLIILTLMQLLELVHCGSNTQFTSHFEFPGTPDLHAIFKDGVYTLFNYDAKNKRYNCIKTTDFRKYNASDGALMPSAPNQLVYDDENNSKLFNGSGGLILFTNDNIMTSSDSGETWNSTQLRIKKNNQRILFQRFSSAFWDPYLKGWLTYYLTTKYDDYGEFFINYILYVSPDFSTVRSNFTFKDGNMLQYRDFKVVELFVMQQKDVKTQTPFYVCIFLDTMKFMTFYIIGWMKMDPTANAPKFEASSATFPLDYSSDMSDITIIDDGNKIKTVRTLLVTIRNGVWGNLLGMPRDISIQNVNNVVRLVQKPAAVLRLTDNLRTFKKVKVARDRMMICYTARSFFFSVEFEWPSNSSKFGIMAKADKMMKKYTFVGYDTQANKYFVQRSNDIEDSVQTRLDSSLNKYETNFTVSFRPVKGVATIKLSCLVDYYIVEAFFNEGETVISIIDYSRPENSFFGAIATNGLTIIKDARIKVLRA